MAKIGEIEHRQLGRVVVNTRPNSRRVSARWRNGLVSLNVPRELPLPDINRLLDDFAPRLLQCRPAVSFSAPSSLSFDGVEFILRRQSVLPGKILATAGLPQSYIEIGSELDLDSPEITKSVSSILCNLARKIAAPLLLPQARAHADRIGRHPAAWTISTGFRTLGTCSCKGVISLSYVLVFLPADLRDYIICHELAHLSEMNHSPRFHQLLDSYLGGREREMAARLRAFTWPVLRK